MEVENQGGQGPLWAVVPLMTMMMMMMMVYVLDVLFFRRCEKN
jgi:hypothetical protein